MMHFDNNTKEMDLIEKGDYETTLKAEWAETRTNKTKYINISFQIRKDVEQKYQGRMVFDPLYASKETGAFSDKRISALLDAIPNAKRDFENYDEIIQYINNTNMIVTIDVQPRWDNPDENKNVVKAWSYRPTEHPVENNTEEKERPTLEEIPEGDIPW